MDRQYYVDDTESLQDRKLVKRTKSFWRFGKNHSDNEILEGMSLWKHRDLVDVNENNLKITNNNNTNNNKIKMMNDKNNRKNDKSRRDDSIDSDRTINAKQIEEEAQRKRQKTKTRSDKISRTSYNNDKQQEQHHQQRKVSEMKKNDNKYEDDPIVDEFYDDGDDGLMLRTVNRKNILQQYTNDSTGPDSGSESEMTSDDPYDCIVVDDQAQKIKRQHQYPDVHAIGKKLEKLSKSTKYNDTIEKKNAENNNRDATFKTFGINESQNGNNNINDKDHKDSDGYYKDKRNQQKRLIAKVERRNSEKLKYYSERHRESVDEFSDATENRQFLPRTKLHKTNSNNSNHNKYDNESSLMEYGETLQRRLKSPDHGSKFDEKSPHSGNMYGPWYDLWGLDASVRK